MTSRETVAADRFYRRLVPYRVGKQASGAAEAPEGVVSDMVRQFADRYAFVRELVQNGIDAGCGRLEVHTRCSS